METYQTGSSELMKLLKPYTDKYYSSLFASVEQDAELPASVLDEEDVVGAIYCDFRKVSDGATHTRLMERLNSSNTHKEKSSELGTWFCVCQEGRSDCKG